MLGCVIINTDRSELPNLCTAQATRAGTTRADIRAACGLLYSFPFYMKHRPDARSVEYKSDSLVE